MEQPARRDDIYLIALRALFWVVCIGIFAFAAFHVWPLVVATLNVLTPFIVGLILAYVLHPLVGFVQHRLRLGRLAGVLAVGLMIVLLVLGFLAILVPILYQQISASIQAISDYFAEGNVLDRLISRFSPEYQKEIRDFMRGAVERLRDNWKRVVEGQGDGIAPVATGSLQAAGKTVAFAFSAFGKIGAIVATTALTFVVTFYYLLTMDRIPSVIRRLLPRSANREHLWTTLLKANQAIGGFIRGQITACIGVGILATILLLAVGPRKYAILIGFIAGLVNFIPYLGPTIGAAPAALWALLTPALQTWSERGLHAGLIVGGFMVIQAIDGFVFQPFIVGSQAALHPLAVILALVVGAQFGIGGMILAVPVACFIKVLFVEYYWKERVDFIQPAEAPARKRRPRLTYRRRRAKSEAATEAVND